MSVAAVDMLHGKALIRLLNRIGNRAGDLMKNREHNRFDAIAVLEGFAALLADLLHSTIKSKKGRAYKMDGSYNPSSL